jgi:sec-independent protein translocase protein TatC
MSDEKQDKKPGDGEGAQMSLWDHLDELRSRLFKSALSLAIIFFIAFVNGDKIINFLSKPLKKILPADNATLNFLGPMEVFMGTVKIGMLSAVIVGAPIWLYQFWKFIEPALYENERKLVTPFALATMVMFILGCLFGFYAVIPMTLGYLIELGLKVGNAMITVKDYLDLVIWMVIGCGLIFETPVLLVLLGMVGILDSTQLAKNRKIVMIVIFIIAAIVTPSPDPMSQVALAIPMTIMYEASIWILRIIEKRRAAA